MSTSLFAAGALALALGATPAAEKDIVSTAVDAGSFETLAAALTEAGLVETLQGDGPFTVFAPTDAAFAALPEGTVADLLKPENRAKLTAILTYHVVPGRVGSGEVAELSAAPTVNGQRVPVAVEGERVRIGKATVVTADIACTNGVIHVIDRVLMPETRNLVEVAAEAGSFGTLLAAAEAAGLAGTLAGEGPFTILAPSDAAFAALPEGTVDSLLLPENREKLVRILTFHVIPGRVFATDALERREFVTLESGKVAFAVAGDAVTVQGANVTATDIQASNGVIHVIDAVLMPPPEESTARAGHGTSGEDSCSGSAASL